MADTRRAVVTPQAISALAAVLKPGRHGNIAGPEPLTVAEAFGLEIAQIAAWPHSDAAVAQALARQTGCAVPDRAGTARDGQDRDGRPIRVLWMGPERYWVVATSPGTAARIVDGFKPDLAVGLDLSHSRTILRLTGAHARTVLAKGLPVDTHPRAMPVGSVVQSQIGHMGVTVHLREQDGVAGFDLYVLRGFGQHFFEWVRDAAAEFGVEVVGG